MDRRRRDTNTSIAFTEADIFVFKDYPRKFSSLVRELQYIVLLPTVSNQSMSQVLDMRTTRNALEYSKVHISKQLGVKFIESKIVQWENLRENLKEPQTRLGNKSGVSTYVGVGSGATVLIILLAFSIMCHMRR